MRPLARCVCMRIAEYHVVRDNHVVAIEEGTMVRVEGERATVRGAARVKVFRRGQPPAWVAAGAALSL